VLYVFKQILLRLVIILSRLSKRTFTLHDERYVRAGYIRCCTFPFQVRYKRGLCIRHIYTVMPVNIIERSPFALNVSANLLHHTYTFVTRGIQGQLTMEKLRRTDPWLFISDSIILGLYEQIYPFSLSVTFHLSSVSSFTDSLRSRTCTRDLARAPS